MSDENLIQTINEVSEETEKITINNLNFSTIGKELGEPDRWSLTVTYCPLGKLLETISVRKYLNSYKDDRLLVEEAGAKIARDLHDAVDPQQIAVEATVVPSSRPEQTVTWTI